MQIEREALSARIEKAQNGDGEEEQSLFAENLPLVTAIAKRYMHCGLDFEDLKQLGSIGLLKAIRRFDASYRVCFSTYAVPLIAGEIRRFLRDDGLVKFSRSAKSLAARVRQELTADPDLTSETLSGRLGVSREDLAAALASDSPVRSLDEAMPDGIGNMFDRIAAENTEERFVDKMTLDAALQTLSARERLLVNLRFREEKSQTETGKLLGVSQVQVSRLEKKILLQLRSKMLG